MWDDKFEENMERIWDIWKENRGEKMNYMAEISIKNGTQQVVQEFFVGASIL